MNGFHVPFRRDRTDKGGSLLLYIQELGVYFDNKLNFEYHLETLCKKAGQKLHALIRVSSFMSLQQQKIIMNAFITSQFGYCPLIWMCHSRKMHRQIDKIHKRGLRIVYMDNVSSFDELLVKSISVYIPEICNILLLKSIRPLSSSLMSEIFRTKKSNYSFRNDAVLVPNRPISTMYGVKYISHLAPKIWELIPNEIRNCESLNRFRIKIKTWSPKKCPCYNPLKPGGAIWGHIY